jgi:hypothetical protein
VERLASARPVAAAAFVRRWGISLASLASGGVTLVVFRRGVPHVGWIVGYALGLALVVAALRYARDRLVAGGRHRVVFAGEYTVQTLAHGLLLFVLPGYFVSTTFGALTTPFFLLLAAVTLLTTIDPWYRALILPRPGRAAAVLGLALFAGLNVAWPLIGLAPGRAALASAALASLAVARPPGGPGRARWRRLARTALPVGLAVAGAWLLRPAIPPVPLQLIDATLARAVVELEPVEPVTAVSVEALRAWGGLVAYTPVVAPAGLRQAVLHRWRHEGTVVSTVPLPTAVRGGRARGFRTFSHKTDFPADPRGRWTVDVLTASGQLIGRVAFRVTG